MMFRKLLLGRLLCQALPLLVAGRLPEGWWLELVGGVSAYRRDDLLVFDLPTGWLVERIGKEK